MNAVAIELRAVSRKLFQIPLTAKCLKIMYFKILQYLLGANELNPSRFIIGDVSAILAHE